MFGKKKDKGQAKEKPAKKAKKSKPKSNEGISRFGDGGLKTVLVNNIEKVALLAIGLTAAYLAFSSWKTPGLKDSQAPEQLASEIQAAERNISSETWSASRDEPGRRSQPAIYETKATADVKPVSASDYLLTQPLEPLKMGLPKKRGDVQLLPLVDLEVEVVFGPLAVLERKKQQTTRLGDDGGGSSFADEDPNLREIPDETSGYLAKRMRAISLSPETKIEARQFVCVTGLIPLKEQAEMYVEAYQDANGFSDERDLPRYTRHFQVERAKVQPGGKLDAWKLIWDGPGLATADPKKRRPRGYSEMIKFCFGTQIDEVARQDATIPFVTMPLPALVNRDLSRLKHSKIKTAIEFEEEILKKDMEAMAQGSEVDPYATGAAGGGGGGYGSSDGGGGGYGGGGGGYGAGGGYGGGGGGYGAGGGYGGGGGGYGAGGGYGGGGGTSSDGGGGYGGGGGGYGGSMSGGARGVAFNLDTGELFVSVEKKMFRFFDFSVQPGVQYRYRVRLALEDPNDPESGMSPPQRILEADVIDRRRAKPKWKERRERVWWRLAEWSEPSPVAAIGGSRVVGTSILAGSASTPDMASIKVGNRKVSYPKSLAEPAMDAIVVAFDKEFGGDIPGHKTLFRGSVANFPKKNIELVDLKSTGGRPMLRKKKEHRFRSDILVLDIVGGDKLSGRKGESLTAPGEMLVFTASGQLQVRRELDDVNDVSYYTFPEDEEKNSPYGDSGGGGGGGYGSGGYGGGGYGGGGGKRKARGKNRR